MKRLLLTISFGILMALIVSSVAASQILRLTFDKRFKEEIHHHHQGQLFLVETRLNALPEAELQQEIERLNKSIMLDLKLLDGSDASIPPDIRAGLQDRPRMKHHGPKGPTIFVNIHNGKYVAVLEPPKRHFPFSFYHLLIVLGIILPIVGLTGFILAYPVAKRLRALEEATISFGQGDLDARAGVKSSDAIGNLARRFNQMADRVQALLEDQQHLLHAVSHELRTPISRIRFNLEMLDKAEDDGERHKRSGEIESELDELNELVNELLLFIRFDDKSRPADKQLIDLDDVLADLSAKFGDIRPEVTLNIQAGAKEPVMVLAKGIYFKRALQNLLVNAISYADSRVEVTYSQGPEGVTVVVQDDGPGIPLDRRERIFKPFTRLDDSRNRDSGGVGLGLAIVRRIMQFHGGAVTVSDNNGKGARFTTLWPQTV